MQGKHARNIEDAKGAEELSAEVTAAGADGSEASAESAETVVMAPVSEEKGAENVESAETVVIPPVSSDASAENAETVLMAPVSDDASAETVVMVPVSSESTPASASVSPAGQPTSGIEPPPPPVGAPVPPPGVSATAAMPTAAMPTAAIPPAGQSASAQQAPTAVISVDQAKTEVMPAASSAGAHTAAAVAAAQAAAQAAVQDSASETLVMPTAPAASPSVAPNAQAVSDAAANLSVIGSDESAFAGVEMRKKRKGLKVFLITLAIIVVFLGAVYGVGAYVFSQRFLPDTSFGDVDISMMEAADLQELIDGQVKGYQLDLVGGAFSYRATSSDLGLSVDSAKMAQEMIEAQNQWAWPVLLLQGDHEAASQYALTYDTAGLEKAIKEKVETYNEGATPSQNATIVYDENTDQFVVQPDVTGTQYEPQAVIDTAESAISSLTPFVTLTDDQLIHAEIRAGDEKLTAASEEATKMVSAHLKLKLDGQDAGEIGPDDLHYLIHFDEDLNVTLDEDELSVWIDSIVKRYDTVGSERSYTRPDGKEITVSGGEYGWQVDQDALRQAVYDCVYGGSDMEMDIPCWQTAQVYNGQGQPDWGNRYADVDLSEQYVRFYDENGDLIWESACITGQPDGEHDTVEGVWSVNNKESPSKLIGRDRNGKKEYETTVQYWMAFEQNAIGFHDATWQPAFGGEMYRQGYGSHGCVNLPYSAAEELYYLIDWDDVVIVHW